MLPGGLRHFAMPNFIKLGQSFAKILRFFQDGTCHQLGFRIPKILLADGVRRAETHHHAKFRQSHLSVANILQFFNFFFQDGSHPPSWTRWRPSNVLDLFRAYLNHAQRVLGGLYHSAKFGYDRCSSFDNMNVSIFGTFGWKTPIHAQKFGLWGFVPSFHQGCIGCWLSYDVSPATASAEV